VSTGLYILQRAARAAHILASSETFQPGEAGDALDVANGMLDAWSAQRLMIFTIARQVFTLNSGQQTYQMGTGAPDFNVARPSKIENFGIITLANPSEPLELPLYSATKDEWAGIPVKNIPGALPTLVYDDSQFPYRNINLWPVPNVTTLQLAIYAWQSLASLALATNYTLPPGYYEALIYGIALRLATEWPGELTPQLEAAAAQSMKIVKTQNSVMYDLKCDPALVSPAGGVYNWLSDTQVSH
jgi:hypothetical protein